MGRDGNGKAIWHGMASSSLKPGTARAEGGVGLVAKRGTGEENWEEKRYVMLLLQRSALVVGGGGEQDFFDRFGSLSSLMFGAVREEGESRKEGKGAWRMAFGMWKEGEEGRCAVTGGMAN